MGREYHKRSALRAGLVRNLFSEGVGMRLYYVIVKRNANLLGE